MGVQQSESPSKQFMLHRKIEKTREIINLTVKTDGYPGAHHDLQIFFVDNRCAESRG